MLTRDAETSFLSFLADRAITLPATDAITATTAMIDWYETSRADDITPLDQGGDTLALSWGMYSSVGVPWFEYETTRRLTVPDPDGDTVWQYALRFRFEPSEVTAALGSGAERCPSPDSLPAFRTAVHGSLLAVFARFAEPAHVETRLWPFGCGFRANKAASAREFADAGTSG